MSELRPSSASRCASPSLSSWRTRSRETAQLLADCLERLSLAVETEAQLENAPLVLGQAGECTSHLESTNRVHRLFGGILGARVAEEIPELGLVLGADVLIQRDRRVGGVERLVDVLQREARSLGELLACWLAVELRDQLSTHTGQLQPALVDMRRHADRLRQVRDRTLAGLADPPGRVGRELEAAPPVELLDRAVQADDTFLNQVAEGHVVPLIALGDRDDQPQVRVDHPLLRREIPTLDPLGERDLLGRREQGIATGPGHEQGQCIRRA